MFDVDAARAALLPMDWANPQPAAGPLVDYVRFYGLGFGGRIAGLMHGIGCIDVDTVASQRYRIAVQYFRVPAPRGTVLVLHGFYDHAGIYDHLIGHLLARDLDVVVFDLPGHGLSSGARAEIRSFTEYQQVLAAVLGGLGESRLSVPLSLVGQSTGGGIILEWLLRAKSTPESSPFAAVATFSPLVRPANWWRNRILYHVVRPFTDSIPRKFVANSHDEEFLHFLREVDPLQARRLPVNWVGAMKRWFPRIERATPCDYPLRVIQGDEDGTVDWQHNLGVIRRVFPRVDVRIIPTGRHQLVNEAPALRAQVFAVLDEVIPRAGIANAADVAGHGGQP